jgi:hypothetical protein
MGWNSFDCFSNAVTEEEVKANADLMATRLSRFARKPGMRRVVPLCSRLRRSAPMRRNAFTLIELLV